MSDRPRKQLKIDSNGFESTADVPEVENEIWSPSSWRTKPIKQQPDYKDKAQLDAAMDKLKTLPPLVMPGEVDELKAQLREVAAGERFILQGGDCAERFQDCNAGRLQSNMKLLLEMSLVLVWGTKIPLTRIGRVAGQYMKPRSKPTEMVNGKEVLAYKGDAINGIELDDREHNPARLVEGYFHSASTLNYLRGLLKSGFADLTCPRSWDLSFCKKEALAKYSKTVEEMASALQFMKACGASQAEEAMKSTKIFTSHEGLVLDFEEAMTRRSDGKYYNLGAHFVWIGDRTRQLDGAHIEYFRGIENPIGCKCGPTTVVEELIELIQTVNPANDPGKIVLISRFGADKVKTKLREIIKGVTKAGLNVVWQCDPMHGNTFTTETGIKTRAFEKIYSEILETFDAHADCGTWLGGVHFELTGENVTECVGGSSELGESCLSRNYESFCDPRLNWQQSIELAFKLVEVLKQRSDATI